MKNYNIGYLIAGILFLLAAIVHIGFNALGNRTADFICRGLYALAGLTCFYLSFQKRKQENE